MSNQNNNEINNEDLLKIQNEIDNLEQKLFSDNNITSTSMNKYIYLSESNNTNSNNLNSQIIQSNNKFIVNKKTNEKINEKSYKFNINSFQNNNENKGNDKIKIIENDDTDSNENSNDKVKKEEKIKQLLELQKEIDKLRQEKGKKINDKLHKIYNNSNNKTQKNKIKNNKKK